MFALAHFIQMFSGYCSDDIYEEVLHSLLPWRHNEMISCDKYKRWRQYLNGGHQRITYKSKEQLGNKRLILTLRLIQNNQWVRVDHAAQINLMNLHPLTSRVDKNEINMTMAIIIL